MKETMLDKVERLQKLALKSEEEMVGKTIKTVIDNGEGLLITFTDNSIIKFYHCDDNYEDSSPEIGSLYPDDFVALNLMTKAEWVKWDEEIRVESKKQQKEDIEKAELATYKRLKAKFEGVSDDN